MPYINNIGTNPDGNYYVAYKNGAFRYINGNGSSYADDGHGHQHYTNPDGDDGWHYNGNQDYYTSGRYYRGTDRRHRRR